MVMRFIVAPGRSYRNIVGFVLSPDKAIGSSGARVDEFASSTLTASSIKVFARERPEPHVDSLMPASEADSADLARSEFARQVTGHHGHSFEVRFDQLKPSLAFLTCIKPHGQRTILGCGEACMNDATGRPRVDFFQTYNSAGKVMAMNMQPCRIAKRCSK